MEGLARFLNRAEALLAKLEPLLPLPAAEFDWRDTLACQWRRRGMQADLYPVSRPHLLSLADIRQVDKQKERLRRNTQQFVQGLPANNALLWGARGTGKSSLVKALLNEFARDGLRLIEVDKFDLQDLPDIVARITDRPERFLLFCDDLSFEENDARYKTLKAVLEGSVSAPPDNLLVYATSNRRHLLPEQLEENRHAIQRDGEIHPGEAIEEKISLSDRFGLWLSFYPFSQDEYLDIVDYWLAQLGMRIDELDTVHTEAIRWALARGNRSGRTAWQFARDWVGAQNPAAPLPE